MTFDPVPTPSPPLPVGPALAPRTPFPVPVGGTAALLVVRPPLPPSSSAPSLANTGAEQRAVHLPGRPVGVVVVVVVAVLPLALQDPLSSPPSSSSSSRYLLLEGVPVGF